ncbi:PSP1 domain-containing protein [Streptococcus dentiloxodontae]
MSEVIGIKFEENGSLIYVLPNGAHKPGDFVVIKEAKGKRLAEVVLGNTDLAQSSLPSHMNKVLRLAEQRDFETYHANLLLAERQMDHVKKLILKNELEMKLIDIVFPLEKSYVLITFVSEKRVDFRQLLKDLAGLFKTRIELRQISTREEAKIYGGLGPCGRALCCSSFLGEFPPVSIKMAKEQNLSLNSGKTSGVCGRLMCCLSFEDDFYQRSKENYPDLGQMVWTKDGQGQVAAIDVIAETVKVSLGEEHSLLTYAIEEVSLNG